MPTNAPEIFQYNRAIQRGRGDSFTVKIPDVADGGYDITGYTYACEIETKARVNVATYTVNITGQVVTFSLTHGTTAGISVGNYVYDVKETPASGSPRTLFRGSVNVSEPVTE